MPETILLGRDRAEEKRLDRERNITSAKRKEIQMIEIVQTQPARAKDHEELPETKLSKTALVPSLEDIRTSRTIMAKFDSQQRAS